MSLQVDLKFIHLISPRFEKFVRKHDYLFNCRCPLCGDSHKNKSKMRGYLFRKGNDMFYMCHNCGASVGLGNFIKQLDPGLFREYIMERYKEGEAGVKQFGQQTFNIPSPRFDKVSKELSYENAERCDKLPEGHFCLDYLKRRQLPIEKYKLLWYTDNYKKFVDEVYPKHGKKISEDKRLVIPYYDEYNVLLAVSGRALETSEEKLRYVTVRTNNSENKLVYGCDRIILSQKVLLVEGPIDSLFLNNSLASGDANLALTAKSIEAKDIVLVFDNEPRNKDIVKMMDSAIKAGHKIVIWPQTMPGKDINEFVMNGISVDQIDSIISSNTFSSIQAQLKFNMWKKL
jgi:hypothetical protein